MWTAATPPSRLRYRTCANPACPIIPANPSWSGHARIDVGHEHAVAAEHHRLVGEQPAGEVGLPAGGAGQGVDRGRVGVGDEGHARILQQHGVEQGLDEQEKGHQAPSPGAEHPQDLPERRIRMDGVSHPKPHGGPVKGGIR